MPVRLLVSKKELLARADLEQERVFVNASNVFVAAQGLPFQCGDALMVTKVLAEDLAIRKIPFVVKV